MTSSYFYDYGFKKNDANLWIYFDLDMGRLMIIVLCDDDILLENNVLI